MKILYFVNGMHPGGKERRLLELLKFVRSNNPAEVELALMSRDICYPEVLDLSLKIHYLTRRTKKDLRILYQLFALCKRSKPDIIHTWDSMTSIYAAPVAKLLGIRFVNGMITDAPQRLSPLNDSWIRFKLTEPFSDAVVANSRAGLAAYNVRKRKRVCIYNGFNSRRTGGLTDARDIRKKFALCTSRTVGMVGEFADRKDFDGFVRAAQAVLRLRKDVTFLAVGDGENLERCRSLVKPPFKERVRFLGWQADVESIVNMMDIGVLATNADVHGEGISNSILEYMAFGKPVVATDSGGTKEIVIDGVTGFLVPGKADDQLARRIVELLDDPARARLMGERGKQRVGDLFGINTMVSRYFELYERLIAKGA